MSAGFTGLRRVFHFPGHHGDDQFPVSDDQSSVSDSRTEDEVASNANHASIELLADTMPPPTAQPGTFPNLREISWRGCIGFQHLVVICPRNLQRLELDLDCGDDDDQPDMNPELALLSLLHEFIEGDGGWFDPSART